MHDSKVADNVHSNIKKHNQTQIVFFLMSSVRYPSEESN